MRGMALIFRNREPAPCAECGSNAVNHSLERAGLTVDFYLSRIFEPLAFFGRLTIPPLRRLFHALSPWAAAALLKSGLATETREFAPGSPETTLALWTEAKRRNIDFRELCIFGLPRGLFLANYGGRSLIFRGLPLRAGWRPALFWMDDKARMKKKFKRAGFPVPSGGLAGTEAEALKIFRGIRKPAVVKPYEGSAGRHTTAHIQTEAELLRAFQNARRIAPFAVVEEELEGPVFRATLVGGRLAGVLRRDPPQVRGDGRKTLRELVRRENENPLRRGPVFAEINPDSDASRRELARQGLTPESVPADGQTVYFDFKVNWGVGGTSRDATAEVHPDNKMLFEDIGGYLREDIVGIDFITPDIGRSWREVRSGVIELNSLPQLGNHHFPYTGPVRNVAGAVWDMVYPSSSAK